MLTATIESLAQQTDPALTAAVTAQTFTLKDLFDARHSTQEKILAATGIEEVQLQQLHDIEKKVLDYMANVSGLMQNLYQVKRTTELVTVEIPRNINAATNACKGHLKGTAIALAVSDEIRDIYAQIGSLSALCTSLVKTKTVDGNKVNLLNAAERYWLCEKIVSSLEDINSALYVLSWQIQYLSWEDLWRGLDPETWCNYMQGRWMAESCIRDWDDLMR
jgi:hypothetical protein